MSLKLTYYGDNANTFLTPDHGRELERQLRGRSLPMTPFSGVLLTSLGWLLIDNDKPVSLGDKKWEEVTPEEYETVRAELEGSKAQGEK